MELGAGEEEAARIVIELDLEKGIGEDPETGGLTFTPVRADARVQTA